MSNDDLNRARELLLKPIEKGVLMQLANISKPDRHVFVTIETLVQWSSLSHASVLRALNGLERLGLIVRWRGARGRATGYILKLPDDKESRRARLARQKGKDHGEPIALGGDDAQRDTDRLTVNQQGSPTDPKNGSQRSSLPLSPVFITGSSPESTRTPATPRGQVSVSDRLDELLAQLRAESTDDH